MQKCIICSCSDITNFKYGNHLNKINLKYFKHKIALLVAPIIRKYMPSKSYKLLFTQDSNIVKCNQCGHGYYDRVISQRELNEYYEKSYWFSVGEIKNIGEVYNDRVIGQYLIVKPHLESLESVRGLEIGAGAALFSRYANEKLEKNVMNVVEPGARWETYYNQNGIQKVASYFPDESIGIYNYIHTSHWLEHVLDVRKVISDLSDCLEPGGFLYVEVPNCTDEYYTLDIGDVPHINFFTVGSLSDVFECSGFEKVSIGEYGYTVKENYMMNVEGENLSSEVVNCSIESIKNSLERKNGEVIRAVFKKI